MCIIAIKPIGVDMFSNSTIKTMFINNPDGAGYMYYSKRCNKVVIKKGFTTCKALLKALNNEPVNFKNTNLILHFRISTSGLVDGLNCHPFPVYDNNAEYCKTDLAVAHNGVMPYKYIPAKTSKINDTQVFIHNVLRKLNKGFINDKSALTLIGELIGTNKLAFLDSKNKVTLVGNFIADNGYLFSNGTYKVSSLYPRGYAGYSNVCTTKKPASDNVCTADKKTDTKKSYTHDSGFKSYKMTAEEWDFWRDDHNAFWDDWDVRHA